MNVMSINIRGFGVVEKKATWIRNLRRAEKVQMLMVQETGRSGISDADISSFWGNSNWEKAVVDPSGRSGGLLCVWEKGIFSLTSSASDPNFLLLTGNLKGNNESFNFLNVYAPPQSQVDKRELWSKILGCMNSHPGLWFLAGDFNVVRGLEERKNSKFKPHCAREFNEFIFEAGLCEYEMKGSRFTYMLEGPNGRKFSKIDRFLVCNNFQNKWPEACVRVLPRGFSDHNHILVSINSLNFGPKPFRFFSSWLDRPDFGKVVEEALSEFSFSGPPDLRLLNKFRILREKIKTWRDELRSKEGEEVTKVREELDELDIIMEDRDLTDEEEWIRLESKRRIQFLEDLKSKDIKQRARTRWASDGDDNTAYFHRLVNKRKVSNSIPGLLIGGVWVTKPTSIKKAVHDFFRDKYKEEMPERPNLECSFNNSLTDVEANMLIERFSREEIKTAVFECGSDKSPGPNGFNMKFIKRFWGGF
ncbi:putative Endonuclease/exonuclease/phosphatase superfamily [Helianthus debilis subsp. tardiflorus]